MRLFSLLFLVSWLFPISQLNAQVPDHYYHLPANAGASNQIFHQTNGRMVFIYTQSELASTGLQAGSSITSLWFRNSTLDTNELSNFRITIAHTTHTAPGSNFNSNFDLGQPAMVYDTSLLNYRSKAGAFNVPTDGWTEIPLNTSFAWDGTNNLIFQLQFTLVSVNSTLFYGDSSASIFSQYHDNRNGSNANRIAMRPMVGFSVDAPLPAEAWQSTAIALDNGQIRLEWDYAFDGQVSAYFLERSGPLEDFEVIGEVTAGQGDNYEWVDANPLPGLNLYRVSTQNEDGDVVYSATVTAQPGGGNDVIVFPNPVATGKPLYILSSTDETRSFSLTNSKGRLVDRGEIGLAPGIPASFAVENLTPGIYFLHLRDQGKGQIHKIKVSGR